MKTLVKPRTEMMDKICIIICSQILDARKLQRKIKTILRVGRMQVEASIMLVNEREAPRMKNNDQTQVGGGQNVSGVRNGIETHRQVLAGA